MKHRLFAPFRRTALAVAVSTLYLAPAPSVQAAEPGPIGGEFQVNTLTAGDQNRTAIAVDAVGDFVVAWQSYVSVANGFDIRAQRYNAAGVAQGGEISVNTVTAGNQTNAAVGIDADGDFVLTWDSVVAGSSEIRARRYSALGVALSGEISVNTATAGNQRFPAIDLDADGDFVVAWETFIGGSNEIRAQRYSSAGIAQGGEISVNTVTAGSQTAASIGLDADGDFVVAWSSEYLIRTQRFSAAGVAQGGEISIDAGNAGPQFDPVIDLDADGDFVVAWTNYVSRTDYDIRARRYSAAGTPKGGVITVNAVTTSNQLYPAISVDADGDFVVAWESIEGGSYEIRARRYSSTGQAQDGEIKVNTVTMGSQRIPAVGLDADGDFVVAWESSFNGSDDIRAQRYQGPDSVDISLFQTDSTDPAPVGSPITYSLSVGNLQTPVFLTGIAAIDDAIGAATGVRVIDTLPTGSTAASASGAFWTCAPASGNRLSCDYGKTLLAGEEAEPLVVSLTPPNSPGTAVSNVGRATANPFDANLLNNREVESTQVVCAESVIELSASVFTVTEAATPGTVSVTRSGGACGVASVQFDTSGSSATAGLDFTDVTGTLSWANGELGAKTFSVPIRDDAMNEIDERVQIILSGARGASLGSRSSARLTINDDDPLPRVNFTSRSQSASEASGLLSVTVQLSELSGRNVTVPIVRSGTATSGSDYFLNLASVSIPAGVRSASFDIEVIDDASSEPDETAILTLRTPIGAIAGTINPHTVTITDNDAAPALTVSFDLASASADEATASTVRVLLSAASTQSVTVPYTLSGAAKLTTDYSLNLPSPIVFNPGEVEKSIVLTPVNDTKDESDENAILTLGTPTNATLGTTIVHTRTIIDNDP